MKAFNNWSIAQKTGVIIKTLAFQLLTYSLVINGSTDNAFKNWWYKYILDSDLDYNLFLKKSLSG